MFRCRGPLAVFTSCTVALVGVLGSLAQSADAVAPRWLWVHQAGTVSYDAAAGVAVDGAGNSVVVGTTAATLPNSPELNAGGFDAFIAKYDANGALLWLHQLGSAGADQGSGVAVDSAGNAYVVGNTASNLPGAIETNLGFRDAFVAKYDANGTKQWVHQLGTAADDAGAGVAVDAAGNAYVTGTTSATVPGSIDANAGASDAFVAHYDTNGNKLWVRQLGTSGADTGAAIALVGNSAIAIAGDTAGVLPGSADANAGGTDAFLASYDISGNRLWVRQLGSPATDNGTGTVFVPGNAGGLYLGGSTLGTVAGSQDSNAGNHDAFVARFDASGNRLWSHQLGSSANDFVAGIAADVTGSVFLAGWTFGVVPGSLDGNSGQSDALVAKYDSLGNRLWAHELGSIAGNQDQASGIAIDGNGNARVAGWAQGVLKGSSDTYAGGADFFLGALGATNPGVPTGVTAVANVGSITVSFGPPVDDGGTTIVSYSVTCASSDGGIGASVVATGSPIVVSGLTKAKTYACTATAVNLVGTGAASSPSNVVKLPDNPAAPNIGSATIGNGSISLAFTAGFNGGSAVTQVGAACTSADGGAPGTNTGLGSPIAVTGLTNGKTYTCVMSATNAVGVSPQSAPSLAVSPASVPGAPIGLSVTGSIGSIQVGFSASGNDGGRPVTRFDVACTSSDGGVAGIGNGTASPIVIGTLSNAKTYSCTATATNAIGTSATSGASNSVTLPGVPSIPTIGTALIGNAMITVPFVPGGDGGSAVLQYDARCISSNGGTAGSALGAASPIAVNALTNGKTYSCQVAATNAVGSSAWSVGSNVVIPADAPGAPTGAGIVAAIRSVSVSFAAPSSDGGAPIISYQATCVSSDGGAAGSGTAPAAPILVGGFTNGKTYSCTVVAKNAVGNSVASLVSNSAVLPDVPGAPNVTSAASANHAIVVSFAPPSNGGSAITSYSIVCQSSDGGPTSTVSGSTSPLTIAGVANAKTYTCAATATNAVGTSAVSNSSTSVIPAGVPDAPTATVVKRLAGAVSLTFTAGFDEGRPVTGFSAQCASSNGGAAGLGNGTSQPIIVVGLTNGNAYTCTVTATNAVGTSLASGISNVVVPADVPSAPGNVALIGLISSGQVQFAASTNNGGDAILGYTADCISIDGGAASSANGSTSPLVVSGLTNGATYACQVTATNGVGVSGPSMLSNVVQIAGYPEAPRIGRAASGNGVVVVAFNPGFDGGSPVTRFDANCVSIDGGVANISSASASPITVGGLTNATTYTCTVTAINAVGASIASPVSNLVRLASVSTTGGPAFVAHPSPASPKSAVALRGDFNGDGYADVLWYGSGKIADALWQGSLSGFTVSALRINGVYTPIVGDFNGDSRSDVVWYAPGKAKDAMWLGALNGFVSVSAPRINGVYTPIVGDFNGDSRSDLLWYGPGTASDALWYGASSGFVSGPPIRMALSAQPFVGDFNGDGKRDVLWYGSGPKADALWLGATHGFSVSGLQVNGVYSPFVGDFNGDGSTDVFWFAPGKGHDALWIGGVHGLTSGAKVNINGRYTPIVGDFNRDGRSDIIWYAPGPASDAFFLGTSSGFSRGQAVQINGTYVSTVGDYDGTGTDDLLWSRASGGRTVWWRGQ